VSEWRTSTISELARGGDRGVSGGPFGSSLGRKDYVAHGVPVIRGAQLSGAERFSLNGLVFVSDDKASRHTGNLAYPGDVIVTQRGTLGQVGLIPKAAPYDRFLLSQSQMKISAEPAVADPEFMNFALTSPPARRRLIDHAMIAGVPHINLSTLREFEIDVPSLETQRRVAAVLSAFDELIEINERRIELLEDLARSLYREWFVRFRFPGHADVEFVHSALGPLPEGWLVRTVAQLADAGRNGVTSGPFGSKLGRKDYVARGVPVIRGANLDIAGGFRDNGFVYVSEIKAAELASSLAGPGDIVVTQRGTLGQVGMIPTTAQHERYVLSQSQMKVTVDRAVAAREYVYEAL
jgi:type I restriction enzyme, S subunit